jgi:pilus assembly protein TadC
MALLNIMFKIASIFRLGIPLAYALFVSLIFPNFVQNHETLTTIIFFALLGMVALSWVVTIRKKILRRRQQKQI